MIKKRLLQFTLFTFSLFVLTVAASAQKIFHVNINTGNDDNDGLKWSTAFKNLQPAIDEAGRYDIIYVAKGTYHPTKKIADAQGGNIDPSTPTTDVNRSFLIKKDVKIYGGFPAYSTDATTMNDRNWESNRTTLSGDFNNDDGPNFENTSENALHVVVMLDATPEMVLDGFYIEGGVASAEKSAATVHVNGLIVLQTYGGGIYAIADFGSSPTLSNLVISNNYADTDGGGVFNYSEGGNSSSAITNVTIINNVAKVRGGGYYSFGKSAFPKLKNVLFSGNEALEGGGFAIWTEEGDCSPELENVLISGNIAHKSGGAYIWAMGANACPKLINTTICGNRVTTDYAAGGIYILSTGQSKPYIKNTVIWGNKSLLKETDNIALGSNIGESDPTIENSLLEGIDWGGSNLEGNTNPRFAKHIDADNAPTRSQKGDYQLSAQSPLINRGDNAAVTLSEDLAGQVRIFSETVDIGAYESKYTTSRNETPVAAEKSIWSNRDNIFIKISNDTETVCIYSINGAKIKEMSDLGEGIHTVCMPEGLYVVSISTGEKAKVLITKN